MSLQQEQGKMMMRIRSDHERELENGEFNNFCELEGIHHEYSAPLTP